MWAVACLLSWAVGCGDPKPAFVAAPDNGGKTTGADTGGGPNLAPDLHKIGDKVVQVGTTLLIEPKATDPNGDALTFSLYGAPPDATWFPSPPRFTWTPQTVDTKGIFLTFLVSDGLETDRETVQVNVVTEGGNHPPAFQLVGDQAVEVGQEFVLQLQASDPDGNSLEFGHTGELPAGASLDAQSGAFAWTPTADQQDLQTGIEFTVSDGTETATLLVRFFVVAPGQNKPPAFEPIAPLQAYVGQQLSFTLVAVDDNDPAALTFGLEGTPPQGSSFNPSTHTFVWKPLAGQVGGHTLSFWASDGQYKSYVEVDVTVHPDQPTPGQCGEDVLEPNNSATDASPITVGTYDNLSICDTEVTPVDSDWYAIGLSSAQTLSVSVMFSHAQGDIDVHILAAKDTATVLAKADSSTDNEVLSFAVPSAGTYLIRVFGTGQSEFKSPYSMELSTSGLSCQDDDFEPNDSFVAAKSLSAGSGVPDGFFCPGDLDFYRIPLSCGATLTGTLSFTNGEGDLDLYVYRESDQENEAVKADTGSNTETVFYGEAPRDEDVFLLVTGNPPESTLNGYTLTTQVTGSAACVDDDSEPDNSKNTATQLQTPSGWATDLVTCCSEDWFFIPLAQGDGLLLTVKFNGTPKVSARLMESDGETVLTTGVADFEGLLVELPAAQFSGSHYLVIEGEPGTEYAIDLEVFENSGCTSSKACPDDQICKVAAGQCVSDFCSSESDCPAGQEMPCENFTCLAGCTYDADCKLSHACKGFAFGRYCGKTGSKPTGGSCFTYTACDGGASCQFTDQGGYCTKVGCKSNAECPNEASCIEYPGMTLCAKECSSNDDCRVEDGFSCQFKTLPNGISTTVCLPIP